MRLLWIVLACGYCSAQADPIKTSDFGVTGYSTLTEATNAPPIHTQLQTLFDSVNAIGGATVEFENGRYYFLGGAVDVRGDGVAIHGNGSTVLRDFHSPSGGSANPNFSAFHVGLRQGTGSDYVNDWTKGVRFEGFKFRNIGSTDGQASDPGYFTNLNGVTVPYNRRQNKRVNIGAAIYIDQARGTQVENCQFYECGTSVLTSSESVAYGDQILWPNINMESCEVRDWGMVGVLPGQDSVIKNCSFIQNAPRLNNTDHNNTLGTSHAVYVSGGKANVRIEGCRFYGARYFGVQWYTSSMGSPNGMVLNCHFFDCFKAGTCTADSGISHDNFIFSGNSVSNCGPLELGSFTTGNLNQLFTIKDNTFQCYTTNDASYQLVVRSGQAVVQGNVFKGALFAHVLVKGGRVLFYRSTGNTFFGANGSKLSALSTDSVIDFFGDSYQTTNGIFTVETETRWGSCSIRNTLFNCAGGGVLLPNGAALINNVFLLESGSKAYGPYGSSSSNPTIIQGNTFLNAPNATTNFAIENGTDSATNQIVALNNYCGPGVALWSSATASDLARFKPSGLFDRDIYGSKVVMNNATLWTDGTNVCVTYKNNRGTSTTNKVMLMSWP